MELRQATLLEITEVRAGSEVIRQHEVGETVLEVYDSSDFGESGTVEVEGVQYPYISKDDDADTVTLGAALTAIIPEDSEVWLYPYAVTKRALVQFEDNEDAELARVPHNLVGVLEAIIREGIEEESVLVRQEGDETGNEYVIADVIGSDYQVGGEYIDPIGLPPAPTSDGVAPTASPQPTLRPGIGSIFAMWTALPNADPLSYDVHVSPLSPVLVDNTTKVGNIAGTMFNIKTLADGTDLQYGQDYYVAIVARDEDGAAPPSPEAGPAQPIKVQRIDLLPAVISAAEIADGAVVQEKIAANAVTSPKIAIADFTNRVKDPRTRGLGTWAVNSGSFGINVSVSSGPDGDADRVMRITADGVAHDAREPAFAVTPGETLHMEMFARRQLTASTTGVTTLSLHYYDTANVYLSSSQIVVNTIDMSVTWVKYVSVVTVPALAATAVVAIRLASNVTPGGLYDYTRINVWKRFGGELLVDGGITADKLGVNAVTAGKVDADAITSRELFSDAIDGMTVTGATVRTASSGRRVQMDSTGLKLIGSDDSAIVDLPNDPNLPAVFRGDAEINHLTVNKLTTLAASELAEAATFTMQSSVKSPSSPPSMVGSGSYYTFQYSTGLPWSERDGVSVQGNNLYTLNMFGNGELGVERFDNTTGDRTAILARINGLRGSVSYYSIASSATNLYVVYYDSYVGDFFIDVFTLAGVLVASNKLTGVSGLASNRWPALTYDATPDEIIMAQADLAGYMKFRRFSGPGLRAGTVTNQLGEVSSNVTFDWHVSYVAKGAFDFGVTQYVIAARTGSESFKTFNTLGVLQSNHQWPSGIPSGVAKVGAYHDGTYFYSIDDTGLRRRYEGSGNKWSGSETKDIQFAYTWYKSTVTVAETTISPVATVTFSKRSRLHFTTAAIPSGGPDRVRLYARDKPAEGTIESGIIGNKYALNGTVSFTSGYVLNLVTTPGQDPTDNTFGSGVPSSMRSASLRADGAAKTQIDGDGFARMDGLLPPGSMMMYGGAAAPTGWVFCHGQALSRTTYADLFNALGGTSSPWGLPNSSTFNVPDMRLRLPIGAHDGTISHIMSRGASDGRAYGIGRGDSHSHVHNHTTASDGSHSHTLSLTSPGMGTAANTATGGAASRLTTGENHTHSGSSANASAGSNHSHTVNNETGLAEKTTSAHSWQAVHYIIKT